MEKMTVISILIKLLSESGNLQALILLSGIVVLSSVILVLWKKILDLHKEVENMHERHEEVLREMLEQANLFNEEKTHMVKEINNTITTLIAIAPHIVNRGLLNDSED